MNVASRLSTSESKFISGCAIAAMIGGLLFIVATVTFALTHGTQSEARTDRLFGISSTQFAKAFQPTIWFLFTLGVIGVNRVVSSHIGIWGRVGFIASVLGYGLAVLSWILQVWIVDPNIYFYSVYVQGGFALWLFALMLQMVGMVLFGFTLFHISTPGVWRVLPFLIGISTPVVVFGDLYVFDTSDGTSIWTIIYILLAVPSSLCWLLLGRALWSETNKL